MKGRSHVVYDGLKLGFVNDLELAFLLYVGIIGMHYQPSSQFGFSIQNSSVMTSFNCQLDVTENHLGRVSMKSTLGGAKGMLVRDYLDC